MSEHSTSGRISSFVYISDENYHDLTLVSIASAALTQSGPINFLFFQAEYEKEIPFFLRSFVEKKGHSLTLVEHRISEEHRIRNSNTAKLPHVTVTANAKADCIAYAASLSDLVVYCDSDILMFEDCDFSSLLDRQGSYFAVRDLSFGTGVDRPAMPERAKKHGFSDDYLNSGMIAVKSADWLKDEMASRFLEARLRHETECPYFPDCRLNDQCAFNMIFDRKWVELPFVYNAQRRSMHTRWWREARIRHYTGNVKFAPIRLRSCDRRERRLLFAIAKQSGYPIDFPIDDFGLSYFISRIKRHKSIRHFARTIEEHDYAGAVIEDAFRGRLRSPVRDDAPMGRPPQATGSV